MRVETKEMFIADDGTPFATEQACAAYEVEQAALDRATTYWSVIWNPDLTEGRGHYGFSQFKLVCHYMAQEFMEDFCYSSYGRRVEFVQGASPTPNWILTKIDKERFNAPADMSIGTSKIVKKRFVLKFDDKKLVIAEELV